MCVRAADCRELCSAIEIAVRSLEQRVRSITLRTSAELLGRARKTEQLCDGLCVSGRKNSNEHQCSKSQHLIPESARRSSGELQAERALHKILRSRKTDFVHLSLSV